MSRAIVPAKRRRWDPTAFELYCEEHPDRNPVTNLVCFCYELLGVTTGFLGAAGAVATMHWLMLPAVAVFVLVILQMNGRKLSGKLRIAQLAAPAIAVPLSLLIWFGGPAPGAKVDAATQDGGAAAVTTPAPKVEPPSQKKVGVFSQWFGGNRDAYKKFGVDGHTGVDVAADCGVPAFAPDTGTVADVGNDPDGYGWYIDLANYQGESIRTSHYQEGSITVKPGDQVRIGQQWAAVGTSGNSTGCHVHFELKPRNPNVRNGYGGAVNPANWSPSDCKLVGVPAAFGEYICPAAQRYGVNPALVAAIIAYENRFNVKGWPAKPLEYPWPCSPMGACGPAQFMPDTWWNEEKQRGYRVDGPALYPGDGGGDGVADRHSFSDAIFGSAHYLAAIAKQKPDPMMVAAEYNCGPRCGGPFATWPAETRDYAPKVVQLRQSFTP
jgi:hypothetical protein